VSECETDEIRVAVCGHVEWIEFVPVERVPNQGEIVHAAESWGEAAGGGGVASVQLARLAGACTLFTAFGDDELGRRCKSELERLGVRVEAAGRAEPQRHGFTFLDSDGERTITVVGLRHGPSGADPLPWDELASCDGVYFVSGDAEAVRRARRGSVLVATARSLPALAEAGVELDALVRSGSDEAERYRPGDLDPQPRVVVETDGDEGGTYAVAGEEPRRFPAAPLPGPRRDTYGAGDSFAAGLTYALAQGLPLEDALALAARCGAAAIARRGAHRERSALA
jgi:ribokinase